MNSDEVNWLLQTIEEPENAKRFVQAQGQRGESISRDGEFSSGPKLDDWSAVEKPAALIALECLTTRQKIPTAAMP